MQTREQECGGPNNKHQHLSPPTTTMVLGQLVFFDRDPSLWLTHITPKTSRGFAEPALPAPGMALVLVGLATVGFFTSNRPRDTKYDRKGHGE